MTQNMHMLIAIILSDLTWMLFLDKYFLNKATYEESQELVTTKLFGHSIFYIIGYCFFV